MADKLSVYNGALRLCKSRQLTALTEDNERIRLLNAAWVDAVDYCLEAGQWTWATRTGQIDYTPSVEPDFGYRYAFTQPTDMVDVVGLCEDEYFQVPLLAYSDERHYWYADLQTIYARWVSNDATYGADTSLWDTHFAKFVEAYLAKEIIGNLTDVENLVLRVIKQFEDAETRAKSNDAMKKPTKFPPEGAWASSRRGRWSNNRSGGRLGV